MRSTMGEKTWFSNHEREGDRLRFIGIIGGEGIFPGSVRQTFGGGSFRGSPRGLVRDTSSYMAIHLKYKNFRIDFNKI